MVLELRGSFARGPRSIRQIAVLGVVCTFLGTTVFFPALLALLERWRGRCAGGESAEGRVVHSLDSAGTAAEQSEEHTSA